MEGISRSLHHQRFHSDNYDLESNADPDEMPKRPRAREQIRLLANKFLNFFRGLFLNARPDELPKRGQIKPENDTEFLNARPDQSPERAQIESGAVPEFPNACHHEELAEISKENPERSKAANSEIRLQQEAEQPDLEKKVKSASILALALSVPTVIAAAGIEYMNKSVISHGKLILDRLSIGSSLLSIFAVIGLFYSLQEGGRVGKCIQERLIMLAIISAAMSVVSLAMIAFI